MEGLREAMEVMGEREGEEREKVWK